MHATAISSLVIMAWTLWDPSAGICSVDALVHDNTCTRRSLLSELDDRALVRYAVDRIPLDTVPLAGHAMLNFPSPLGT